MFEPRAVSDKSFAKWAEGRIDDPNAKLERPSLVGHHTDAHGVPQRGQHRSAPRVVCFQLRTGRWPDEEAWGGCLHAPPATIPPATKFRHARALEAAQKDMRTATHRIIETDPERVDAVRRRTPKS